MSRNQKSPLQAVAIWAGLALIGLPLALLTGSFPLAGLALIGWLAFCFAIRALARWLGWRTALMQLAFLVVGALLALLLFLLASNLSMLSLPGSPELFIVSLFLGLWSILSGLVARNARSMYVAIHLSNWFFCLGIMIGLGTGWAFPYLFLPVPLGIMILLLGFHKPVIQMLTSLPFLQKNKPSTAVPKSDDSYDYERGYQSAYEEGGSVYPYQDESDKPTIPTQWTELRQQQ